MATEHLSTRARSLYRSLLRELPPRPLSSGPSPLKIRLRSRFKSLPAPGPLSSSGEGHQHAEIHRRLEEAEQFVAYARAQRMYTTLLERYNPGVSMDQEEKVRLTARRVGMELPVMSDHNNHNNGQ